MRYLLLLFIFSSTAEAKSLNLVSDAIAEFCQIDKKSENEFWQCADKLNNCIIPLGREWNDKDLFRCMKQYEKGASKKDQ